MKRNCSLDVRLHSSSAHSPSPRSKNETLNVHNKVLATIHDGRHCIFDKAELQARVIIWLASREMEERIGLQPKALLMYGSRGLSMKSSLQNFLQNRKKRSRSHMSTVTTNSHTGVN